MGVSRVVCYHSSTLGICKSFALVALCSTSLNITYRNHAANAYMLHALGITHVVSVGECALIPPENHGNHHATTAKPGSLWIEEKEGRIKVLDIKDVCDDGIDSLEPQLPPICEWIDEARRSGGKVLVHRRVGVSRSATVTVRTSYIAVVS